MLFIQEMIKEFDDRVNKEGLDISLPIKKTVSDDGYIYKIDAAMCAGFGWEMGPFAMWDSIGLKKRN